MGKYQGGKKEGNMLYVRVGDRWMEIKQLIQNERK